MVVVVGVRHVARPAGVHVSGPTRSLARRYAAWRVGRGLDGLHVAGVDGLRAQLARGPVLAAANHVAWWDGLVALAIGHHLGADVALVAQAETLERYPWLSGAGVIPLGRGPRLRSTLRAAERFLDRPGRMLWYFPQGRQRPDSVRPLGFQRGISLLARHLRVAPTPVALAYPFREVEVPAAALVVRDPVPAEAVEDWVEAGLSVIGRWADGRPDPLDPSFSAVLGSRRTPVQQGVGARMLTAVVR